MALNSTLNAGIRSQSSLYPLSNDLSQWVCDAGDMSNPENRGEVWLNSWSRWKSLAPFFASHHLYLYEFSSDVERGAIPPATPKARHSPSESPPWARKAYSHDEDLDFDCLEVQFCSQLHLISRSPSQQTVRIWPARDAEGHEVVIR